MSHTLYGVVAVGNALVDVLSQVSNEFLDEQCKTYGVAKGGMTLIEEVRAVELYTQMPRGTETSGGSAANTMAGYASFGGKGAFIGKVADDDLGKTFSNSLKSLGIHYKTNSLIAGPSTGRCMIMVTPDAERTMNTFLGASVELSAIDVDPSLIASAQVTYLEGYLFDKERAKQAFITAAELAHDAGHKIALTLSDPFCVDRHRHDFINLVQNHVDILFANEDELKSLFQQNNVDDAMSAIGEHVEVAAITQGAKGATIISKGERIQVPAQLVTEVVDTTGAGDQFAAGFLYGYTQGKSLETCGKYGAMAAAEVISHIGPRPHIELAKLLVG